MVVGENGGFRFESRREFRNYVRNNIGRIIPLNELPDVLDMLQGKIAGLITPNLKGTGEEMARAAHRVGEARDILRKNLAH